MRDLSDLDLEQIVAGKDLERHAHAALDEWTVAARSVAQTSDDARARVGRAADDINRILAPLIPLAPKKEQP